MSIVSPCVSICRMEGALCVGCFRTIDEIAQWSGAAERDKLAILAAVEKRREAHDLVAAPGGDVRGDSNR
jgi:predicted Fe-S protein YdhL (DUF1289 family)